MDFVVLEELMAIILAILFLRFRAKKKLETRKRDAGFLPFFCPTSFSGPKLWTVNYVGEEKVSRNCLHTGSNSDLC